MTLRISALFLLTSLVLGPTLLAQSVFHDSHAPQVSFASAEIDRALGPQRAKPDRGMQDLKSDNSSLRFAIAAGADESKALAQALRVAPLKTTVPQSYAIRRAEARGRVTIVVLGADPVGAMYGGLDVAEAIRLGRSVGRRFRYCAARNQIQHPAGSPDPNVLRQQRLGPGEYPRDVEYGLLARIY
jgi:alpha-glucuronidase